MRNSDSSSEKISNGQNSPMEEVGKPSLMQGPLTKVVGEKLRRERKKAL